MMTCYLEKCAALHYFGAIFLAILHDEGFEDTYVFCISCPKNSLSKHTRNQRGRTEEALMMTRTHLTHSLKVIAFQASMSRWSGLKCSAPTSSDIQEWPTLHRIRLFQEVTLAPDEARLRRRHPPCKERIGCIQKWKRNLRSDEDGAIERWYWHGTGWFAAWSWLMPAWELISSDSAFRA